MSLITKRMRRKSFTRQEDELIIKLWEEGKKLCEIASELKRPLSSITQRVYSVLTVVNSFDEIKYL